VSHEYTATGWYATFDPKKHPRRNVQNPVEAWSADGEALVLDGDKGRLVPAARVPGFEGLMPCRRIVQVVPAQPGWKVTFPPDEKINEPEPWTLPVLAWIIDDEGEAKPLLPVDGDGDASVGGWPKGVLTWPGKETPVDTT
jgi:hypothetical protein